MPCGVGEGTRAPGGGSKGVVMAFFEGCLGRHRLGEGGPRASVLGG